MKRIAVIICFFSIGTCFCFGQTKNDTLITGKQLPIGNSIKNSKDQFIMYRIIEGNKTLLAFIEVEYMIKGNELHIVHRRSSSIQQFNGIDSSIVDLKTFAPKFFYSKYDKQEEVVEFEPGKIINITGPKDSVSKVKVDFKNEVYNALTINELLGRVKMKLGNSYSFATYNPIMKSYTTQQYTVAGEEKIILPNNEILEVWRVDSKQNQGNFKIWISKKTQYPIKLISELNGIEILEKRLIE